MDEQIERLRPFFPNTHGKARLDAQRVLSGLVFLNHNGLRWRAAPDSYGSQEALYNWCKRWGERGVFSSGRAAPKNVE